MKLELNGLVREVTSPVDIVQMRNDGWREVLADCEIERVSDVETVQETEKAVPGVTVDGKKNKRKKGWL